MNHSDIQRVNSEIDKFLEAKKLADALDRLRSNADFKLVIEQGYCTKKLDSLVYSLAIVSTEANVNQTNRQIAGIGSLMHFLDNIANNGLQAETELPLLYKTQEHLMGSDNDNV